MGFVGNYVPCGLSPQTDGMPLIQNQQETSCFPAWTFFSRPSGLFFLRPHPRLASRTISLPAESNSASKKRYSRISATENGNIPVSRPSVFTQTGYTWVLYHWASPSTLLARIVSTIPAASSAQPVIAFLLSLCFLLMS